MERSPSIAILKSFSIGYQQPIASANADITLGEGNHYLLARNGRGKTTLLKTLSGGLKPKSGNHECSGRLQFVNEFLEFDRELTPKTIFRALLQKSARPTALKMAEEIELDVSKPFSKLSRGNRQKAVLILAECRALAKGPQILLLDEPFTGLDAFTQDYFIKHWESHRENVLRVITCHPESDEMEFPSVMTITGEVIEHVDNASRKQWKSLKTVLN